MGIRIERHLSCGNNPSGIVINLGYYALAECIICGTYAGHALSKWCGITDPAKPRKPYSKRRKQPPSDKEIDKKVLEIYKSNPRLKNIEIAKMVDRSNTYVSKLLKIHFGLKRNRWEYKKEDKK